ncbi:MAG TPA: cation diffusion facilitator family transporter [Nitrosopumilaceae archaeon]|nr:cation diffusion facilitator family transporter [Nitrosopumilaceae archaeon]
MSGTDKSGKSNNSTAILSKGQHAARQSVITLACIGIAELTISLFTGSITLTADGIDSMADSMISFIVWFGILMVKKPRSRLFHFGYRKVEVLAAFIAAIIIIILGAFIAFHAFQTLYEPRTIHYPELTMITLVGAGSISLHRAFLIRKVAIESNLISLKLDARNSIKDGTSSFVGFASVFAATFFGFVFMDAIGGMIIAGYIFFMAYTAIKESALVLVDAVQNPQMTDNIKTIIIEKFKIKTSDIFLRPVGQEFNAEIHIILPNETRLDETSRLVKEISTIIKDELQLAHVVIVPEPEHQ